MRPCTSDVFEDVLDIDWQTEGDELLHHMWVALAEKVSLRGHAYQQHRPTEAQPYFYFGYSPDSDILTSELALVPTFRLARESAFSSG